MDTRTPLSQSKTAIAYCRVSTEEQAKSGYSLPDQLASCHARAAACGAGKIIDCVDEGVSGGVLQRPGLEKARALVRAGGISLFVVLDPDRLARKLSHQLLLTEEFERAGVRMEFVNFDWKDTPEGRLFYSLRGAVAEYEKEKIRERTVRGRLQKAKSGLLPFDPKTYGYIYKDSRLLINPETAAIVRLIFDWYLKEDLTYYAIAQRLNQMGIPSPRDSVWYTYTVKRILANLAYTGRMYVNRYRRPGTKTNRFLPKELRQKGSTRPESEWISIDIPRIIDDVTLRTAERKAARARSLRPGNAGRVFLLTGVAICGICGAPMSGRSSERKRFYYGCSANSGNRPLGRISCGNKYYRVEPIEEYVWNAIVGWLSSVEDWIIMLEARNSSSSSWAGEMAVIEEQMAKATNERERLLDALQKGLVRIDDISARLEDIYTRTEKLQASLTNLRALRQETQIDVGGLEKFAREKMEVLDEFGPLEKRELIRKMVDRVVLSPDEMEVVPGVPRV